MQAQSDLNLWQKMAVVVGEAMYLVKSTDLQVF